MSAVLAEQIKNLKEDLEELKTNHRAHDGRLLALERFKTWLTGIAVPLAFVVGLFSDDIKEGLKLIL